MDCTGGAAVTGTEKGVLDQTPGVMLMGAGCRRKWQLSVSCSTCPPLNAFIGSPSQELETLRFMPLFS